MALPTLFVFLMATYILTNVYVISERHLSAQESLMSVWENGEPTPSSHIRSSESSSLEESSLFQKTSGPLWQVWDKKSILFDDMNLTCNWNDYRPFIRGQEAPAVSFCAHPLSEDQFVSKNIVTKGRHLECDGLPHMLSHSLKIDNGQDEVLYVDVGANMGTCVMQMLLTTNATIAAFEPHPYNLFVMTSTFMELEESLRNRIHLFPIALGAESSESTIHMASDNRGHAVVSKVIRINRRASFLPPIPIRVEPLDDILKDSTTVHLMKMDAQGFECYIYEGMKKVLQKTRTVFFELEKTVLNGFDRCSPQVLWDSFIRSGFEMHVGGPGRKATTEMPERGKINIVALNH
jgi:FkbM family methyltransferase